MASSVISSPVVPYVGAIAGTVSPGFVICVRGNTHPACNRFAINLQCGPNICPRDDVLLHIGVDFIRGCVIRNSIHGMSWGPEETQQTYFPFIKGTPFDIVIRCEQTCFNIAVNGQHFSSFEHRIVYHRASHVAIDGDINLSTIEYRSGMQPPSMYPAQPTSMYPAPAPGLLPFSSSTPYPVSPTIPLPQHSYPPSSTIPPYGTGPVPMPTQSIIPPSSPYGVHQPGGQHMNSSHGGQSHGVMDGLLKKVGMAGGLGAGAAAATAGMGILGGKKAWKAQKKARKKALKYGLPLAGAGIGVYALSRAFHSGSSSSSSSSSDEE
ncbi:uncharacterized protein LOC142324916 isoform X2 [Lycorma delicatula]|uniref:uncharacterized protein LOC142324916 isoform X2 n=1 Tax=Lycorma delicatula TaxID=130591 RepID=UPI003F514BC6